MNEKILITSTDLMMVQFLLPHVTNLVQHGYQVDIACSDVGGRTKEIRSSLENAVKNIFTVRLERNPAAIRNATGYLDMKRIIDRGSYDLIWTNEPVMGVITRLAAQGARKKGTKVLYMVHGFHFYKGAPLLYWVAFYPIEWLMSSRADVIATVNREDYKRVRTMRVRERAYLHGIGINTKRLTPTDSQKDIRTELGIGNTDFIILSIGELNTNKNQKVIIQALKILKDPDIHYILCGKGDQLGTLQKMAAGFGLERNIHFLGYRKDVVDICSQSDLYVMPSRREGLPVSSLEAMYCGLPLVTSNIRGLVDIMENGRSGFMCEPDDAKAFAEKIRILKNDPDLRKKMSLRNRRAVVPFTIDNTKLEVLHLIESVIK